MSALLAPRYITPSGTEQIRWVRETIRAQLKMISPAPLSAIEICAGEAPYLQPNDLGAGTDIFTDTVDVHGLLPSVEEDEADLALVVGVLSRLRDEEARGRLVLELLRVAPTVLVLNVDWSAAQGGPAFNRLRDMSASTLRAEGQDPYYGLVQHCEVVLASPAGTAVTTYKSQPPPDAYPDLIDEMASQVLASISGRDRGYADRLLEATNRELGANIAFRLPTMVASLLRRVDG